MEKVPRLGLVSRGKRNDTTKEIKEGRKYDPLLLLMLVYSGDSVGRSKLKLGKFKRFLSVSWMTPNPRLTGNDLFCLYYGRQRLEGRVSASDEYRTIFGLTDHDRLLCLPCRPQVTLCVE